ncbi:hypothetical protein [Sporosarcina cyprini]|uniref:hypothetical protein n=1 Tax=Sporosarcina cyprini TaxID=2910523 RepID=UPI001EDDFCAB|nr:hypothetical protein [Sporosarcina cyprini]MCG3088357.1 hypothetical protein [Sporosarcina cyprini]
MKRNIIVFLLLSIFLLVGCSEVERIQHIEAFFTETSEEGKNGLFEKNGYVRVNAITTSEEGKNYIKSDSKTIEDFYDLQGNYLNTEVKHVTTTTSKVTQTGNTKIRDKQLQHPSTILITDKDVENFQAQNTMVLEYFSLTSSMTDEEKEAVKEHVMSLTKDF